MPPPTCRSAQHARASVRAVLRCDVTGGACDVWRGVWTPAGCAALHRHHCVRVRQERGVGVCVHLHVPTHQQHGASTAARRRQRLCHDGGVCGQSVGPRVCWQRVRLCVCIGWRMCASSHAWRDPLHASVVVVCRPIDRVDGERAVVSAGLSLRVGRGLRVQPCPCTSCPRR